MKLRNLVISVVLLGLLSAVAFFRNRPEPAPAQDPRVGKALLDADTASRAAGLLISDQGKKVELVRVSGDAWRVPSYYDMPADFDKIARFVQDLNEAKVDRFVTSNPERLSRLEFKDSQIELKDSEGKRIWILTLGKTPEAGNGRFVRFGDEPVAFLAGLRTWLDTDPKGWADTRLVSLKPDDVAKVEIPFEGGATVEAARAKKDSPWSAAKPPAGQKLVGEKVNSLLATLTALRFSDTADPKDPSAAEAAKFMRTIRLTTFDGTTVLVSLGRRPEEKKLKVPTADAKDAITPPAKDAPAAPEAKPIAPEFDTIPAGPAFVVVSSSDPKAQVNDLMKRRSFKVDDYTLTGLPQKPDEFFEPEKAK
jgi:hypothetical protein